MIENGSWRRMIDEGKNPIEKKHFRTAFRVINSDSRIPPRGDENSEAESRLKLLREFQDLFEEVFTQEDREDGSNLTQVLRYCETEMYTAYKNNITGNYVKYLTRFVNTYWERMEQPGIERNRKKMKRELNGVKQDLLRGTQRSRGKYHPFLHDCIDTVIPRTIVTEEQCNDALKRRFKDLFQFPSNYYAPMMN